MDEEWISPLDRLHISYLLGSYVRIGNASDVETHMIVTMPSIVDIFNQIFFDDDSANPPEMTNSDLEKILKTATSVCVVTERDIVDKEACAICLDEYDINDKRLKINTCGHLYHALCITESIKKCGTNCPLCRCAIQKDDKKRARSPSPLVEQDV